MKSFNADFLKRIFNPLKRLVYCLSTSLLIKIIDNFLFFKCNPSEPVIPDSQPHGQPGRGLNRYGLHRRRGCRLTALVSLLKDAIGGPWGGDGRRPPCQA